MGNASGRPGIAPRWSHGDKVGVGTAYNSSSQVWYTVWNGIVTELYYPSVDKPQIRDLEFLIADGESLFHEEKRDLDHQTSRIEGDGPAYCIINSDREGRYKITKEIISDPHSSALLMKTSLSGKEDFLNRAKLYLMCAPHLDVGGWSNTGRVISLDGKRILVAEKNGTYMAIGTTAPVKKASCGYVGMSDGWTDISRNHEMTLEFDVAEDGNIAMTAELDISEQRQFVVSLSFGNSLHNALTRMLQSLTMDFDGSRGKFEEQWKRALSGIEHLWDESGDGGELYRASYEVLMTHEDKSFEGAVIASLSIPWGEVASDDDTGGYHLVWTRDMYNSATAAMAAGNFELPLRALVYLSVSQLEDGGFAQNFWIDGTPYWKGIQLDEAAFPVILAWKMKEAGKLSNFDPLSMVMRAAGFIISNGPITQQERWEESSGYSPSTIASSIAALVCAAAFARDAGDEESASFIETYADFLECHVERWTVTTEGALDPAVKKHYIRILPASFSEGMALEDPNSGVLRIKNISPENQSEFPAKDIVDGGFLELVRYGIRRADDPVISDSVRVIDGTLKSETPFGPVWHRYNHDGYGQRDDGSAFQGWGTGRGWPLLTGERGHYEIALGNSPSPYITAMEKFASEAMLLPEQVWDTDDISSRHMFLGRATGSARPLVWAHSEYIKLLRSARDGKAFDRIGLVEGRYLGDRSKCRDVEIWKNNRKVASVWSGHVFRILAGSSFRLHWSWDSWSTVEDTDSASTPLGLHFLDFETSGKEGTELVFTFYWTDEDRWEGRDFAVKVA